ncbi:MAG TPA: hypothetical protein VHT30_08725 [Acidimicrobiales bacterium]|jgi:hypothetical protein|nr:hypothetical protein [Acidimicrobiales bacterium]
MKLTRRLLVAIFGLGVIAVAMVAGSAATPSIQAGAKVATIHFTATAIPGTTTYTLNSTSCTITTPGSESSVTLPCSLNGAGTLTASGNKLATANLAITTNGGHVITLNLTTLNTCGTGSGVDVPAKGNPFPVVAINPVLTISGSTVTGTIQVFKVGNKTVFCETTTSPTTGFNS